MATAKSNVATESERIRATGELRSLADRSRALELVRSFAPIGVAASALVSALGGSVLAFAGMAGATALGIGVMRFAVERLSTRLREQLEKLEHGAYLSDEEREQLLAVINRSIVEGNAPAHHVEAEQSANRAVGEAVESPAPPPM